MSVHFSDVLLGQLAHEAMRQKRSRAQLIRVLVEERLEQMTNPSTLVGR